MPVSPRMATIIIIPNKRPMVLKSMDSIMKSRLSSAGMEPKVIAKMMESMAAKAARTVLWTISSPSKTYTATITKVMEARMGVTFLSNTKDGTVKRSDGVDCYYDETNSVFLMQICCFP